MVTLMVATSAHWPAAGVKVYRVVPAVAVLKAGDQVPVIGVALVEDVGREAVAPTHSGPTCVKVGTILSVMVTLMVAISAHWPAAGVKVYTVVPAVAVLKAGDQVPVIGVALVEDVGSAEGVVAPTQSGPT